jgi:anti-sigma factor RsiW
MCEFSGKLVAWLDRELPAEEAAEVERHLENCSECRAGVEAYRSVSGEISEYCDAALASSARNVAPQWWKPVALSAGAVAALVALFLAMPRTHVAPSEFHAPQVTMAVPRIVVAPATPAPVPAISVQRVHRRQIAAPVSVREPDATPALHQNAYMLPDEPMIQIAIPADEMFPPGAVPEGMHFVADMTIAPDGSADRLQLRPRLAGFERRTTKP